MDNNSVFSVLIANYNNGNYISKCLESILKQTHQNFEIIIVDDASTDDSLNVIQKYIEQDHRIKLYSNDKNHGAGYTKKKCIDIASGYVCGFVDPDDAIVENALEIMLKEHLEKPNYSLIYSTHYKCDTNLKILNVCTWDLKYDEKIPFYKKMTAAHFATFKLDFYKKSKGCNPSYKRAVDVDLYLQLWTVGKVFFVNQPLYYYRQHQGGISLNDNLYKAKYWDWIIKHSVASLYHDHLEDEFKNYILARKSIKQFSSKQLINEVFVRFFNKFIKKNQR